MAILRSYGMVVQKDEEIFNGWKRSSGTMHTQKCMVPLGNLHGSARQLAWLDFATCMVPLDDVHGSASGVA